MSDYGNPPGGEDELRGALAEALHDALCSCPLIDAGTGFYLRDADIDKALAAIVPVVLADRERHALTRKATS